MSAQTRRRNRRALWLLVGIASACSVWGLSLARGAQEINRRWHEDVLLWQATAAVVNARAADGNVFAPCEFRAQQSAVYLALAETVRGVSWAAAALASDVADGCLPPDALLGVRERVQAALTTAAGREAAALPWPSPHVFDSGGELAKARVAVERALIESRSQQCFFEVSRALRDIDAPGPGSGRVFYARCS